MGGQWWVFLRNESLCVPSIGMTREESELCPSRIDFDSKSFIFNTFKYIKSLPFSSKLKFYFSVHHRGRERWDGQSPIQIEFRFYTNATDILNKNQHTPAPT